MFGKPLKLFWAMLALTAIAIELVPAHYPAGVFVTQNWAKAGLFLVLGYIAPMAFWRFSYLNASILASASSAILVELVQAMVAHGHRFSWVELGVKLALLAAGFIIALDVRYERDLMRRRTTRLS
jgi:uncharacterized oligopeptide transporter (OPT) family protein